MFLSWIVTLACVAVVSGNVEGDYCKVLEEYDKFKTELDNYLAASDEMCSGKQIRTDCSKIKEEFPEASSGVYRIKPSDGLESFLAFCDMESDDHGWLVIQRRQDGSEDFYRTWFEYMDGFGNLTGEFWLGNEKIHRLTAQGNYTLRVDLTDAKNIRTYAEYSYFKVANMSEFYNLTIAGYSGNAGDKLSRQNKMRFSTRNLDLDIYNGHCAQEYKGAWWYEKCYDSNLNGLYTSTSNEGIYWSGIKKKTWMKIRLID